MGPVIAVQAYALRLDLGSVPASRDDVLLEIGDRLDHFAPRLAQKRSDLELVLTVEATDVWLAVLLAMAAVTSTGYPVVRLDAEPVEHLSPSRTALAVRRRPRR
jgi:hypothetical protein